MALLIGLSANDFVIKEEESVEQEGSPCLDAFDLPVGSTLFSGLEGDYVCDPNRKCS